jgi:hypothetical protein
MRSLRQPNRLVYRRLQTLGRATSADTFDPASPKTLFDNSNWNPHGYFIICWVVSCRPAR